MWSNWSGSLKFKPATLAKPETEQQLVELVQRAKEAKKYIRVVGAGHSSSPLVETDLLLISMENFSGVCDADTNKSRARVLPGSRIKNAGNELLKHGLAMHNTGDVDVQTIGGAIATGTHGTGVKLQNLSTMLIGARLLTGTGEIIDYDLENHKEEIRALRVSLGTCGIFLKLTLQLQPKFQLHRREWCARYADGLSHYGELIADNRNFDFYWYPRSDMVKLRIMNEPGEGGTEKVPYAVLDKEMQGWSNEILPRSRELRFDEMEYALPAEAGPACLEEIRQRVKKKHRHNVGWRILYRTIAADNAMISTIYGRDSVTISLHQNAGLPFWEYFKDIEPVFRSYGGRPHWGKKHTMKAKELQELYPEWETFLQYRKKFDPEGIFLSPYMKDLLGL